MHTSTLILCIRFYTGLKTFQSSLYPQCHRLNPMIMHMPVETPPAKRPRPIHVCTIICTPCHLPAMRCHPSAYSAHTPSRASSPQAETSKQQKEAMVLTLRRGLPVRIMIVFTDDATSDNALPVLGCGSVHIIYTYHKCLPHSP